MTGAIVGAKTYPALYKYDDFNPLSDVSLFKRAPYFDTIALEQDGICDQYTSNGLLTVIFRYMYYKRLLGGLPSPVLMVILPLVTVGRYNSSGNLLRRQCRLHF